MCMIGRAWYSTSKSMGIIMHNIIQNIFGVRTLRTRARTEPAAATAPNLSPANPTELWQYSSTVWTLGMFLATPTTLDVHLRDDMTHCR